jgi:heterodisulfide reductase subunit C
MDKEVFRVEDTYKCYQCGTCTGDCPVAWLNNDFNPRKIVLLSSYGLDELLKTNIVWICATCFKCTTRCPRDVKPADVLSAVRKLAIKKKMPETEGMKFVKAFTKIVEEYGEISELKLVVKLKGLFAINMLPLKVVWRMFRRGKVSFKAKKAPCAEEVKRIFEVCSSNDQV